MADPNEDTELNADEEVVPETNADQVEDFDRKALEDDIAKKLDVVFSDRDVDEDDLAAIDELEDPDNDGDISEDGEDGEDGEGDEVQDSETGEATADGDDPDALTLPDAHRRSLEAYGWTEQDITENLNLLGEKFLQTAERMHNNRNKELTAWAEEGRKARDGQQSQEQERQAPVQPSTSEGSVNAIPTLDVEKLQEKYGDDEIIAEIVGPFNKMAESVNAMIPQIQASHKEIESAQAEQVSRFVDSFFGSDELKGYQELYGNPADGLNNDQIEARNNLLQTAFDIVTGARNLRRQEVPLQDALMNAHDIVSRDFTEHAIREKIKQSAKPREKGISLRPTKRTGGQPNITGRPRSRKELENRVAQGLARAFNG